MKVEVNRLDHYGIVAGVIKDLGLIEQIDQALGIHKQEEISHGEAISAMILNGLGFVDRPLSLTPQFFENKPLDQLFRSGVKAEHFNRFKLARSLDAAYKYGTEKLFERLALFVCSKEKVDRRFNCEDTTSFSLTGEYLPDEDSQAISITHGYSKDHRPDLKQVVAEMMVSQDGGIPLSIKCWSGNASDNAIFEKRAGLLAQAWKNLDSPRYLIMDSKGYTQNNAVNLKALKYISRVPETIKEAKNKIAGAIFKNSWEEWDENRKYHTFEITHYQIKQRWIVVHSQSAANRAKKTIEKRLEKEKAKIEKEGYHLKAKSYESKEEAKLALKKISLKWKYHKLKSEDITEAKHYLQKGRPAKNSPFKPEFSIGFEFEEDEKEVNKIIEEKACFIISSNIEPSELTDLEILKAYQEQDKVEKGFGFLKSSLCFASSFYLEKASRIEGLVMVMTLALLVYSIAQRRLRNALTENNETIPNQIKQPTQRPTLRWVFQMLEGVNRVLVKTDTEENVIVEGLTEIRIKILKLLGKNVAEIYSLSPLNSGD